MVQNTRHELFRQMALALSHQHRGNATLALAYWENVLRILPEQIQIQNEILEECHRFAQGVQGKTPDTDRIQTKVNALFQEYRAEISEEDQEIAQWIYRALHQQCGGNSMLSLVYWKNVRLQLPQDSLVITLTVQDFCWTAHQSLKAGHVKQSISIYKHLLQTFPEFFEGYLNLSLILYKNGWFDEILPLLNQMPEAYKKQFIVVRYIELYRTIGELSQQFDHIPYVAIESIINDLHIENTFYPSLNQEYFAECISELINREKRFFEKRRKSLEEKAISKTSKQLAQEGVALGQRVTMAKQAGSDEIYEFLYDNDIRIAEVLMNNPNITADDVMVMAQTTHVSEILSLIGNHYKWGPIHAIRMAMLMNPQTLPKDAAPLLELLKVSDLAKVFYKKTIPTEIRIRAKRKIQQIFEQLSQYEKFAIIEGSAGEILKLLDTIQLDVSSFLIHLIGKFSECPDIIMNICRWKRTPDNILAFIGNNPQFTKNLQIKFALLSNPKTPEKTITSLLHATPKKDLRFFLINKHLPSSVKQSISALFPNLSSS